MVTKHNHHCYQTIAILSKWLLTKIKIKKVKIKNL